MYHNLFVVVSLIYFSNALCENFNSHYNRPSRGFISNLIKYLDHVFDFIYQTFVDISGTSITDDNARPETENAEPIGRERISYKGFHLLRIWPRTDEAIENLKILLEQPQVQFWLPLVRNSTVDVMLPPNTVKSVKEELTEQDIEFSILNNDIEKMISIQNIEHTDEDIKSRKANKLSWNRYYKLDDIFDYLDHLQTNYADIMDLTIIGKSAEGRDLKLVRVSAGRSKDGSNKRAIWIDGGIHAREWISTATALFIIRQLVENYKNFKNLIQDLDWYILPVANPDGYVYTHTTDRLWKKSRSVNEDFSGRYLGFWEDSDCKGVDLNENWDYRWNEDNSGDNPCRETFPGKKAFSEPETKAMSNFINEHRDRIVIYLTLHSYSQKWLMPWTPTKMSKTDDYDDLLYMGRKAIESLKKTHGTNYDLASKHANPSFGNSDDWAKNKIGIKYSYTIQLRDKGTYGFLLPPSQILPTSKEIFTGIRTLTRSVLNNMSKNSRHLTYEKEHLTSNESTIR